MILKITHFGFPFRPALAAAIFCYGEMIAYLGMTMPMAVLALVSWLCHPYQGNRSEVQVNRLSKQEYGLMWALTALVRGILFCIKSAWNDKSDSEYHFFYHQLYSCLFYLSPQPVLCAGVCGK